MKGHDDSLKAVGDFHRNGVEPSPQAAIAAYATRVWLASRRDERRRARRSL